MFSLQKILGHDKEFFDLLAASAAEAGASAQALGRIIQGQNEIGLEEFIAARRSDKQITKKINEMLCRTFVTALEREDIQDLANALYKIPKTIEKFAERYVIASVRIKDVDFTRQSNLLSDATKIISEMVDLLRHNNLRGLVEMGEKLHRLEAEGDRLIEELSGNLYSGQHDALRVIILKDLFELLEKALDRCRSAGNVMYRVALRHS